MGVRRDGAGERDRNDYKCFTHHCEDLMSLLVSGVGGDG